MNAPKAGVLRRIRSVSVGWPALGVAALGWLWTGWQSRRGGIFDGASDSAVSFAALWLVFVLLLMAAWDLLVAVDDDPEDPSLGFGPQRFPNWLQPWLIPAAFLIGLFLGHRYWP